MLQVKGTSMKKIMGVEWQDLRSRLNTGRPGEGEGSH